MNAKETLAQIKELGLLRAGNLQEKLNAMAVSFEEELIELRGKCDELQLSHDNIINSLGIKGDGPVSKLVIEYVMGLVAENVALKEYIREECFVTPPHTTILTSNADVPAEDFMPETANTDAAIAEIKSRGLDELAEHMELNGFTNEAAGTREFAANLRAGRKG